MGSRMLLGLDATDSPGCQDEFSARLSPDNLLPTLCQRLAEY